MSAYPQSTARRALFRLSLNSFWLLIARVAGQALAILFTIFVARALGAGAFGSFAFISSIVFIGNVATTFGLDTLIIRDVARQRDPADRVVQETMAPALFIQLALSFLFILVVWIVGGRWVVQPGDETTALRIAVVSLVPMAFSTVFSAALRGHERMAAYMLFSIVVAAVSAFGALLLYRQGGSLVSAAWVILAAQLSGAIVAFALYQSHASSGMSRWRLSRRAIRRVWRGGLGLATLMVLAVLYQRLGIIALSMLDSDTATGLYSAAARVMEALKMLPAAVFGALLPMMAAERAATDRPTYRHAVIALIGISCLMALLCALLARPLVYLLFGPEFSGAVPSLRVMCLSLPLTVLTFALSFNLVVRNQEKVAAIALALTLGVSVILTTLFIIRWSLIGAAVALPISEVFQIVFLRLLSSKAGLSHPAG